MPVMTQTGDEYPVAATIGRHRASVQGDMASDARRYWMFSRASRPLGAAGDLEIATAKCFRAKPSLRHCAGDWKSPLQDVFTQTVRCVFWSPVR